MQNKSLYVLGNYWISWSHFLCRQLQSAYFINKQVTNLYIHKPNNINCSVLSNMYTSKHIIKHNILILYRCKLPLILKKFVFPVSVTISSSNSFLPTFDLSKILANSSYDSACTYIMTGYLWVSMHVPSEFFPMKIPFPAGWIWSSPFWAGGRYMQWLSPWFQHR